MERKYQVFVSSTYTDLKGARQAVSSALLRADCFPSGMELFPAADFEQFDFIKKVIDQCDYYLVILAGRYGSIDPNTGQSYTEMEYDYAVSTNKPVIRLLHSDPIGALPKSSLESTDAGIAKLMQFRQKLSTGRLMKQWDDVAQLQFETVMALQTAIRLQPSEGWLRGVTESEELQSLRSRLKELSKELSDLKEREKPANLFFLRRCLDKFLPVNLISSIYDFLPLVSEILDGKVVFAELLHDSILGAGFTDDQAEALITALTLDGLIKVKRTGEVNMLTDGSAILKEAKLNRLLDRSK